MPFRSVTRFWVVMVVILSAAALVAMVAGCGQEKSQKTAGSQSQPQAQTKAQSPAQSQASADTSSSSSSDSVTIDLVAKNIAFDKSTISVPAGAKVIVKFHNEDQGIPHNFAVYKTSAAKDKIFSGEIVKGVTETTYRFTAPSSLGDYFFRCDVHPTQMTGKFVVK
jgi:plastocyanin